MVFSKLEYLNHRDGFIYFDELVELDTFAVNQWAKVTDCPINRLNARCPYQKNQVLPMQWSDLKGKTLVEIYHKLKTNQFFIYKEIRGGTGHYKIRIKKALDGMSTKPIEVND